MTVPAGAWSGAPAGDWLVVRLDPQPAAGGSGGFQPASEIFDVTAYWALAGGAVTSFDLPLEIEVDNTQAPRHPGSLRERRLAHDRRDARQRSLPAAWNDGFEYDGSNIRILTRHLSIFTLLEDVQAPTVPGGFKGVSRGHELLALAGRPRPTTPASSPPTGSTPTARSSRPSTAPLARLPMGALKLTDKRGFQVAAVDEAGNVGREDEGARRSSRSSRS